MQQSVEVNDEGGVVNLKSCKLVKYCNANCQRNHWSKHKKLCKQRVAELCDEELFEDPRAKEDCPICFLPMPKKLICCISLPPATISSVPIYNTAIANEELAGEVMEILIPCCGKFMCTGVYTPSVGLTEKCPFCNAKRESKDEENIAKILKRVEANDAGAICMLGNYFEHGGCGLRQVF